MLTSELKARIAKIYELVKRGTDGEQAAAQKALDNILAKYNLKGIEPNETYKYVCYFKYSSKMELWLLCQIINVMLDDATALDSACRQTGDVRQLKLQLTHIDHMTLQCAYEYFRRHMKAQWNKVCAPQLSKFRKVKTRTARRNELYESFFNHYCIVSKLYKDGSITEYTPTSKKEYKDLIKLLDVEGRQYNKQIISSLLLN